MYTHIGISILKMITMSPWAGLSDLINCAILHCGL